MIYSKNELNLDFCPGNSVLPLFFSHLFSSPFWGGLPCLWGGGRRASWDAPFTS